VSRQFIIHWPDVGIDRTSWAAADDKGELDSDVEFGTLAEAAAVVEGRRACLIVGGDGVLLAEAHVPGGAASRAPTVARYALEEQLADDVDNLHFALGQKRAGDLFPVAVIDRDTMDEVTARCAEAGLRPNEIVPETLALPSPERVPGDEASQWTALVDADRAVIRLNGYRGFVSDTEMAGLMLEGAQADLEEGSEAAITVFETGNASALAVPAGVDVERRRCDHLVALFASGLSHAPRINLLQGEYSPRTQLDKSLKPWRWTAALAAVLLSLVVVGRWLDLRQMQAEEDALDNAIAESFSQALPGARMQRPRRQIEDALSNLGQGGTSGFTADLAAITDSLASQPQTTLNSLTLRNGRFDLDLTTDAVPSLDALASDLAGRSSLGLEVQSANRQDGGVRARVRVQ
jgi:general secretion pathway protein L